MYKEVLRAIPNIETYPVIALFVFFTVFLGLVIWFIKADTSKLQSIATQAIEDEVPPLANSQSPNHQS